MSFLAAGSPFKAHVSTWDLVYHSRHTPRQLSPQGGEVGAPLMGRTCENVCGLR